MNTQFVKVDVLNNSYWIGFALSMTTLTESGDQLDCVLQCLYVQLFPCDYFALENNTCFFGNLMSGTNQLGPPITLFAKIGKLVLN